jgi:hypothetical protein
MSEQTHPSFDRRSGKDRREAYTEGYFFQGAIERRSGKEQRQQSERREGWIRITKWSSIRKDFLTGDFH